MVEFFNSLLYWLGIQVESTGKRETDQIQFEDDWGDIDDGEPWTEGSFESLMEDRYNEGYQQAEMDFSGDIEREREISNALMDELDDQKSVSQYWRQRFCKMELFAFSIVTLWVISFALVGCYAIASFFSQ